MRPIPGRTSTVACTTLSWAKCGSNNMAPWRSWTRPTAYGPSWPLSPLVFHRRICIVSRAPFTIKSKLISCGGLLAFLNLSLSYASASNRIQNTVKKAYDSSMANGRSSSNAPTTNRMRNISGKTRTNSGEMNVAKVPTNRQHTHREKCYRSWIAWKWHRSEVCRSKMWVLVLENIGSSRFAWPNCSFIIRMPVHILAGRRARNIGQRPAQMRFNIFHWYTTFGNDLGGRAKATQFGRVLPVHAVCHVIERDAGRH